MMSYFSDLIKPFCTPAFQFSGFPSQRAALPPALVFADALKKPQICAGFKPLLFLSLQMQETLP